MVKAVDPAAVLDAVRVERKTGGKTGLWTRPTAEPSNVGSMAEPSNVGSMAEPSTMTPVQSGH
jgi:hypothetical protein